MSIVTLQLGQCGNQLGQTFFQTLMNNPVESGHKAENDIFFREKHGSQDKYIKYARCVSVDMEPKVIQQCEKKARSSGTWEYDPAQKVTKQSGSANNWAYGYNVHGRSVVKDVEDLMRKVMKKVPGKCTVSYTVCVGN